MLPLRLGNEIGRGDHLLEATVYTIRRAFNALNMDGQGPTIEGPRDNVGLEAGEDAAAYRPAVPIISAQGNRDADEAANDGTPK